MRIATFLDPQHAGRAVAQAAIRKGHAVAAPVDRPEVAYIRTLNYGPWRALSLDRIASLHRDGVPTLPSYENSLLYDDKVAQFPVLERWLPRTGVAMADSDQIAIVPIFDYPFVSKSAQGSASHNVRLIRNSDAAYNERRAVFSGAGICRKGGTQRGYLYWQEFIPGNDSDIRVVINGEHLYGLRRFIRSESQPFASGSGKNEPIRSLDDPFVRRAFELTREISAAIQTRWACFDFVRHPVTEKVYVLEVSFSWSEKAYAECPVFDAATLEPNGRRGSEWATFAVDELERLHASAS